MAVTRRVQVSGSAHQALLAMLPLATLGCAGGRGSPGEDTVDAAVAVVPDGAEPIEADAPGCAIAEGMTPVLDGTDDLAEYPAAQQLTPGAMLGNDGAALAWNRTHLFVTITSNAFTSAYEPLHIYVETGTTLPTVTSVSGKEYAGLVPAVPFTATHLIGARRISDSGSGGAYNGVFVPSDGWTNRTFALDSDTTVSADQRTLSVRVPWSALGDCPTTMRLALHVVHAQVANEWKELVPSTHTPWQTPGGGYYEIDLTGSLAVSAWTLH